MTELFGTKVGFLQFFGMLTDFLVSSPGFSEGYAIAFSGNQWAAAGDIQGRLFFSVAPKTSWTHITLSNGPRFEVNMAALCYFNSRWVIGGRQLSGGGRTIVYYTGSSVIDITGPINAPIFSALGSSNITNSIVVTGEPSNMLVGYSTDIVGSGFTAATASPGAISGYITNGYFVAGKYASSTSIAPAMPTTINGVGPGGQIVNGNARITGTDVVISGNLTVTETLSITGTVFIGQGGSINAQDLSISGGTVTVTVDNQIVVTSQLNVFGSSTLVINITNSSGKKFV